MKIRLYHAGIITMQPGSLKNSDANETDAGVLYGEIHVEDDKITFVGTEEEAKGIVTDKKTVWDREIDCQDNLLLPGFKNAHTHTAMTFLRSYADDLPLQEWLYNRVFPMEAKLTGEDQYTLSKLGILEYLTSGITANFDMYLDNPFHAQASLDMGFRTVFCGGMNDFGGTIERTESQFHEINAMGDLVSCQLGFHAEYTTKRESIEELAALANRLQKPMYLHLAETKKEVEECYGRYGMSPVKFLDSLDMFRYGGGGFHGVWMNEEDMEICAEKNVSIVSNPCSNLKLASGIADLCGLLARGVNVALGTDGPASNNALDMFREMYLASVLQKVTKEDASAMDARDVLQMATVGGAVAMGLSECDTLAVGKKADMIMLDMHRPNMQPVNNIVKNIVYSGNKDNVKMTMVNGRILYENGEFLLNEDIEEIYRKSNEIINRMRG